MAIYRQIYMTFWTDPKVTDDFTPEDKYFYLYLLTNPHTTICGCYEISVKQARDETGYNEDTITRLLNRMDGTHKIIRYFPETKEVLLLNWHKYNWNKSPKVMKAIASDLRKIKSEEAKQIIIGIIKKEKYPIDTVSIPYGYPMDTTVTDTVTDAVTDRPSFDLKALEREMRKADGVI